MERLDDLNYHDAYGLVWYLLGCVIFYNISQKNLIGNTLFIFRLSTTTSYNYNCILSTFAIICTCAVLYTATFATCPKAMQACIDSRFKIIEFTPWWTASITILSKGTIGMSWLAAAPSWTLRMSCGPLIPGPKSSSGWSGILRACRAVRCGLNWYRFQGITSENISRHGQGGECHVSALPLLCRSI